MPGADRLLDLEKVRRNWERAELVTEDDREDRLAATRPPGDPYAEGRAILDRVEGYVIGLFAAETQRAKLRPFLDRVRRELANTEPRPSTADAGPDDSSSSKGKQALLKSIRDLEDVCEALASAEAL